jgi:hypothetical protein
MPHSPTPALRPVPNSDTAGPLPVPEAGAEVAPATNSAAQSAIAIGIRVRT